MPDPLALTDSGIPEAIATAAERDRQVAVAYVDDDGYPSVSFRGTAQVIGPDRLAIWARKRDEGLAAAVATRPEVGLVYYGPGGPGPAYLALRGRAHAEPSLSEQVYAAAPEGERQQDPERAGVAVVIDIDRVQGFGQDGPFLQERTGA
ncbi:MAG TPA: pyridoxamine 5'-phosphate oxidase family protein [Miltoncostaea sp.]|nr:pyridoxamine 5'-phosphate oxidase family protein [Miltoncostaea sp.]